MCRNWTRAATLALMTAVLFPCVGKAQAPSQTIAPAPTPVTGGPFLAGSDSTLVMTYGFAPPYYRTYQSPFMPTYLTSINYPWIYGSFTMGVTPITYPTTIMQAPFRVRPLVSSALVAESITPPTVGLPEVPVGTATMKATLEVRVPRFADVWIQDQKMSEFGPVRRFDLPSLSLGRDYSYVVRAAWRENGREMSHERTLKIQAGEVRSVDFMNIPPPAESATSTLSSGVGQ